LGQKTKIDWCDATWNPVTGCLHGCEYCYARRIAERFGSHQKPVFVEYPVLNAPVRCTDTYEYMRMAGISAGRIQPYPFDFTPTFHRYRLDEPQKWTRPRTVFVCSMADLFGEWVPMDWKIETLLSCREAPQHRYLFLTKNPTGYCLWPTDNHPLKDLPIRYNVEDLYTDNIWLGVTYTGKERLPGTIFDPEDWKSRLDNGTNFEYLWRMSSTIFPFTKNKFLSIEPISCDITELEDERNPGKRLLNRFIYGEDWSFRIDGIYKWVIVGAETGNRKDKVIPEKAWIDKLAALCDRANVPIFMKESLRELMGTDFRQEFPWEAGA